MWLYVHYMLFMIANVCVPTELLFSLVGLLRLVPLRGTLTLLTLKDHPSKPGKPDGFRTIRQNRCRHAKACLSRRFRSCTIYARDFTGEGKICPVKHTFHDNKSAFTNLSQHRFMRRYAPIFQIQTHGW